MLRRDIQQPIYIGGVRVDNGFLVLLMVFTAESCKLNPNSIIFWVFTILEALSAHEIWDDRNCAFLWATTPGGS